MSTVLPGHKCPNCGYKADAHTPVFGSRGPRPGDYSVCFSCGACMRYDARLDFVLVSESDLDGLDITDPDIARQLRFISSDIRRRGAFN